VGLRLFDCHASLGLRLGAAPDAPSSAAALLAEMDRLGVERALVAHASGWESLPKLGNESIETETRGQPRLARAWTALPDTAGDTPPAAEWLAGLLAVGARAVWLYPKRMNWSLEDWCAGSLLRALEDRCVPVLLPNDEAELPQVHRLLEAHPGLKVLLCGASYRSNRMLFPLLERHPRLLLALSPRWDVHDGIEQVCKRAGAHKLCFGTNWPACDMGSSITYLAYARIGDAERELIGAGNLERLLAEVAV